MNCRKLLYENIKGKVYCGDYMLGGIMQCLECQKMIKKQELKEKRFFKNKEVLQRIMLFPFKNKHSEKSFGFILSIFGLIVIMVGITNPSSYFILESISTSLMGLIFFFIGLFYFVDSLS